MPNALALSTHHPQRLGMKTKGGKNISVTGNRTLVSRVTGGDTSHYTMTEANFRYQERSYRTILFYYCSILIIIEYQELFIVERRLMNDIPQY